MIKYDSEICKNSTNFTKWLYNTKMYNSFIDGIVCDFVDDLQDHTNDFSIIFNKNKLEGSISIVLDKDNLSALQKAVETLIKETCYKDSLDYVLTDTGVDMFVKYL